MTLPRRLMAESSGPFPPPVLPANLLMLYNGATAAFTDYRIGAATTADAGATWTRAAGNPVISNGTGWEASYVKDPTLNWDGSQWVCHYTGWSGSVFAIGRATSSDGVTWTKYGSNPVLTHGTTGDPDEAGCSFPSVVYDPTQSPPWKMWYQGWPAGASPVSPAGVTVCFADSSDGISWTKRGRVISLGSAGSFDSSAINNGVAVRLGSTWYVYYGGYYATTGDTHAAVATCSDPANAATYTKLGELAGYTGTVTFAGVTWRSHMVRGLIRNGFSWTAWLTVWSPTSSPYLEAFGQTSASDPVTIAVPSNIVFVVGFGTAWDSYSAENPSVVPS